MAEETLFTVGADVSCADGACGTVSGVVVDPGARAITHLVVDRDEHGQLVPITLVEAADGGVRLRCTIAEFEHLDPADETVMQEGGEVLKGHDEIDYSRGAWRFPLSVSVGTLPFGEVAVRGDEHVHASDGDIGQVQGLVMDPGSRQISHVLLREGHVFGRKVVAIPVGAVTGVDEDGIQLSLTRQQVKDLPGDWHRSSGW